MFNNVTLIGYLGCDPESRTTRNNSTLTVLFARDKADLEEPRDGRARVADHLASVRGVWPDGRIRGDAHQGRPRSDRRRDPYAQLRRQRRREEVRDRDPRAPNRTP